eukprot:gene23758-9316_t
MSSSAAADAIKFTVDQGSLKVNKQKMSSAGSVTKAAKTMPDLTPNQKTPTHNRAANVDMEREAAMAAMVCSLENKDDCLMCGS